MSKDENALADIGHDIHFSRDSGNQDDKVSLVYASMMDRRANAQPACLQRLQTGISDILRTILLTKSLRRKQSSAHSRIVNDACG